MYRLLCATEVEGLTTTRSGARLVVEEGFLWIKPNPEVARHNIEVGEGRTLNRMVRQGRIVNQRWVMQPEGGMKTG